MDKSNYSPNGMVVTPHHLASQSAIAILRDGGTAMEAMVAAAATIAVVYPHMNGIGGDGFWLIMPPSGEPFTIEACGAAGSLATLDFYSKEEQIPYKGPRSAVTVAGTVGGWREALDYTNECGYKPSSLSILLADAIQYAEEGYAITESQESATKLFQTTISKDCTETFIPNGYIPKVGDRFCQPQLANTLKILVKDGLDSFYRGTLARSIAADMSNLGIPITEADLINYHPVRRAPLRLCHSKGEVYNTRPPTQGLMSLLILGMLDNLNIDNSSECAFIHCAVEATKLAFQIRDKYITDPNEMTVCAQSLLRHLPSLGSKINPNLASCYGKSNSSGDTIWMGIMDKRGFSVSFIQSLYHEYGSGVLLPKTGIVWHNRGVSFSLNENSILALKPGKKPFHTLSPAAAKLNDGRIMIYGTRGGDGQAQTQAAIFYRYVVHGVPLQKAITAPRWLFGSTWGRTNNILKLEGRFSSDLIEYLKIRGHKLEILDDFSEQFGHAGAIVKHPSGLLEGAFDPRGNGSAAGY